MMGNEELEGNIDELILSLSTPVDSLEAADGWTPEGKLAMKKFFEDLKIKLQLGKDLPPLNLSRALDHWGVVGGDILEKSARLSNKLRLRRSE